MLERVTAASLFALPASGRSIGLDFSVLFALRSDYVSRTAL